jgi:hypothetical protein
MITGALILFTLIYAFFEKPQLFQRPLKAEKIILSLLLLITSVCSYVKEHASDVQHDEAKKTIDSLQGEERFLLTQIDTLRKDNKIAESQYSEQVLGYHKYTMQLLAQYGLKVDTLTKTVDNKETPPTLTISALPLIDTLNKEHEFVYKLRALNANAHILGYYYVLINKHEIDGSYTIDTPYVFGGGSMNFTSIIVPNELAAISIFLDRPAADNCYLAMEFIYKSKGNKEQTPLRKIYEISGKKTKVHEVDSDTFYALSMILKQFLKFGLNSTIYKDNRGQTRI